MKRIVSLLLALFLLVTLMSCGAGDDVPETMPETAPETEAPETLFDGVLVPQEDFDPAGAVSAAVDVVVGEETPVPCIVKTQFPTSELVVADVVATDKAYGADPTGQRDSTEAINNAIAACSAMGGGTVWLPAGIYRISHCIDVAPLVTLRGDWADPDTVTDGNYGTVLWVTYTDKEAYKNQWDATAAVFMQTNAGIKGVTIYYEHQDIDNPVDLGWAVLFIFPQQSPAVEDITLLNAYDGVGLCPDDWTGNPNSNAYINNIKGTVLNRGFVTYNNAGASSYENMSFSPKYWANATEKYNAPDFDTLAAYTRANAVAYLFGDTEMPLITNLAAEHFRYGFQTVPGSRIIFWGAGMSFLNITNTDVAMKIDWLNTYHMMAITNSVLMGSEASIELNCTNIINIYPVHLLPHLTRKVVHVTDCVLSHEPSGPSALSVAVNNPGTTPETYVASQTVMKPDRAVLYNVQKAPYNAPCAESNNELRLGEDCTAAIQQALDDAGKAGGGIVYLPSGHYVIEGNLYVPAGVELRGAGEHTIAPGPTGGSVIFPYANKGTQTPDTDPAAITVVGEGGGIRQLQFYYPENPSQEGSLEVYPYAIRYDNAPNSYGENIFFGSVYMGIDVADGSDNNYLHAISGTTAQRLIHVGKADGCHIETLHDINPGYFMGTVRYGREFYSNFDFTQYQRENCITITSDGATNLRLHNVMQYGAKHGLVVNGGSVEAWNLMVDQGGGSCIVVNDGKVVAMNVQLTGNGPIVSGEAEVYNEFWRY